MRRFKLLWVCTLVGIALFQADVRSDDPESRDPWMRPFDATSIWNTSIGRSSGLVPIEFRSEHPVEPELEYIYQISNQPFSRTVFAIRNWAKGINGNEKLDEFPIDDFLLGAKLSEASRRTACAAFLMPDRRTVKNISQFCRTHRSSPCFAAGVLDWNLFEQNGLDDGRATSGMSILGGALRFDACNRTTGIEHAVKILLPSTELSAGTDGSGYRWPATRNDSKFQTTFKGENPELTIGSLVTLDTDALQQLSDKLTTDVGKSFAETFYRFGAYVVDYSRNNSIGLCMTPEFLHEVQSSNGQTAGTNSFPGAVQKDLQAIFAESKVVKDNSVTSVAGTGERRVQVLLNPLVTQQQFSKEPKTIVSLQNGLMTDGELFPTYWNIIPRSRDLVEFGFDDRVYYSAPRAFRFKSQTNRRIGIYQTILGDKSPLLLSVRASAIGDVKLSIALASFNEDRIDTEEITSVELHGDAKATTRDWNLIEGTIKVAKGQDHCRIMVIASGEGTVWLDDFDARLISETK